MDGNNLELDTVWSDGSKFVGSQRRGGGVGAGKGGGGQYEEGGRVGCGELGIRVVTRGVFHAVCVTRWTSTLLQTHPPPPSVASLGVFTLGDAR